MTRGSPESVLNFVRGLASGQRPGKTDADLLGQFIDGDEDAFAALVSRYGPLVLSVCRSVLPCEQDAEDAFQATFLVLAQRASSIRSKASVGSWLHGVALRIARKAQTSSARRQRRERHAAREEGVLAADDLTWRELQEILHEELGALPEKYRLPLLLCCWEGKTQDEAAGQLGCPRATLKDRMGRARELLRDRLTRRGVALSVPLFATLLSPAAVSAALVRSSTHGAFRFVAGKPGAQVGHAAVLAQRALRSLAPGRLRAAVLVLVLGLCGIGLAARNSFPPRTPANPDASEPGIPGQGREMKPHLARAGDPLPQGALARLGTLRFRQGTTVTGIAFSPDGKRLLSCSSDDNVNLWDAATGKQLRRLTHERFDLVQSVAFSPDGRTVASGYTGGGLFLWNADTGQCLRQLKGHQAHVVALAFSPDGKLLYSGELDHAPVRCWDVDTGQERRQFPGHERGVYSLSLSGDGRVLATSGSDGQVVLWDPRTGKELRRWKPHAAHLRRVALAPDGKRLATTASDPTPVLWDASTGKLLYRLSGHKDTVDAVVFSPDGRTLATGGRDRTVRLWDVATGKETFKVPGVRNMVLALAFSPDGNRLVVGSGASLRVWDLATRRELLPAEGHQGELFAVVPSPDGRLLATAGRDAVICLWDVTTGREVRRLEGHTGEIYSLSFSPDGALLASCSWDRTARIWQTATGKEQAQRAIPESPGFLSFSADGKTLVTAGWYRDGTIRVWEVADSNGTVHRAGKMLRSFKVHPDGVSCVVFSSDGRTVASADEPRRGPFIGGISHFPNLIHVHDLRTGKELQVLRGHFGGQIRGMAFSPDGKWLASGGTGLNDQTLRIWEVRSGGTVAVLKAQAERVVFSPDGRSLAVVGYQDQTIRLYEVATWKVRRTFTGHAAPVFGLSFSPDGRTLYSVGRDTTALVWDVTGLKAGTPVATDLGRLWEDLGDADAQRAHRAVWQLAARPTRTVPYLREHLFRVDRQKLVRLVADLDNDRFTVREKAMRELGLLGDAAEPTLRAVLSGRPSLETRWGVERLLERVKRPGPRLIEVLGHCGTGEARELLVELARGALGKRLAWEAQSALDCLPRKVRLP
jgi:RNA polymerase sigma factor (sigma-70 family)